MEGGDLIHPLMCFINSLTKHWFPFESQSTELFPLFQFNKSEVSCLMKKTKNFSDFKAYDNLSRSSDNHETT